VVVVVAAVVVVGAPSPPLHAAAARARMRAVVMERDMRCGTLLAPSGGPGEQVAA